MIRNNNIGNMEVLNERQIDENRKENQASQSGSSQGQDLEVLDQEDDNLVVI